MVRETEDARDERKRRFIAALKEKSCRDLINPLARKIKSYEEGSIPAEEVFKTVSYVARESREIETLFKKRPDVILAGIAMDENLYVTEVGEISVKVRKGDVTVVFTDAIVNPASPDGAMSAGLAGAIKSAGGADIEKEALSKAPIEGGNAVATGTGSLPNRYVLHAPTVDEPGGRSSYNHVEAAVTAALKLAEELEIESIAIPGMGTGAGGIAPADSAKAIITAIKSHEVKTVSDITLIDRTDEMVGAFTKTLEQYDEEYG